MTTLEVLQNAVWDYNLWASKRGTVVDTVKQYQELRGILFNKICTVIQSYPNPIRQPNRNRFIRKLCVEDLECEFVEGAFLKKLGFRKSWGSGGYVEPDRMQILEALREASSNLVYESFGEEVCYKIVHFITQIQNFKVS